MVSAASAQGLPPNIRTHMTNTNMGATHTIKVAAGTTSQQALITALQAQQLRQNTGQNIRIQPSGSLVAVSMQQSSPQSHMQQAQTSTNIIVTSQAPPPVTTASVESPSTPQQQQAQAISSQQVRNIIKKRVQNSKVTKNS